MLTRSLLRLAAATCAAAIPSLAAAQTTLTFDATRSFPAFNAPGSPFQAGYVAQGDYLGALTPYADRAVLAFNDGQTLQAYSTGSYGAAPYTPGAFLSGPTGVDDPNFTPKFGPTVLGLHPGANGELSTIRFVAPYAGVYAFSFTVYGLDAGGTTSDANLAVPDSDYGFLLYGGSVNGSGYGNEGTDEEMVSNVALDAGQFVDFSVGYGDNETYYNDMTALDLRVTGNVVTPEPATFALVGAGVLALGAAARRRRQA